MRLIVTLFCLCLGTTVQAHEFWISPHTYITEPKGQIVADIRVGQNFEGGAQSYIARRFRRFDLVQNGVVTGVTGRLGDRPALHMDAPGEGLVTVVYVTRDNSVTYRDEAKFESFVTEKAAEWVLAEHKARDLPVSGFREQYSRYAKSLIAVGDGAGSDQNLGLETEIVALANPYTDNLTQGLPVQVLYQGAARPNAQVEIFAKLADGSVTVTRQTADTNGIAVIFPQPGVEYLLDSVVLRPLTPAKQNDPVWESLWASMTFRLPPR